MTLLGILLDFDGTIAETERFGHRVAYNRAFAELGFSWTWDEATYGELLAIAGGRERIAHYRDRYLPVAERAAVTDAVVVEIHRTKARLFEEIAPSIPLRPGVARFLNEARTHGVRVAIATTAVESGVEAVLAQHPGVRACIDLIAGSAAVERKKPAPDVFLWAMDRLGLAPSSCVAVEDSSVGLRATLAAHLTTLVTVSDYTAGQDFTGAAAVLSDLGEAEAPARTLAGRPPEGGVAGVSYANALLDSG